MTITLSRCRAKAPLLGLAKSIYYYILSHFKLYTNFEIIGFFLVSAFNDGKPVEGS